LVAKSYKKQKIAGISVKPQQHIATKENQFRKILMPFLNYNNEINSEVRLLYVTHQSTGLPIYFRYCSDKAIDAEH
jgi:hypothetical protein